MTNRQPSDIKNLDSYGNPPLEWSRVLDVLEKHPALGLESPSFLGTASPDGKPHAAGIGPYWFDGAMYFVSGPETRKSRELAVNPACTISVSLKAMDLVLEGTAAKITDANVLETLAARYRDSGWPAEVDGTAFTAPYSAPSAGPPPWNLYRLDCHTAYAVASEEPYGATRWRFGG